MVSFGTCRDQDSIFSAPGQREGKKVVCVLARERTDKYLFENPMIWEGFVCWYSDGRIKKLTFNTLLIQLKAIKEMLLTKFLVDCVFREPLGTTIVFFLALRRPEGNMWCVYMLGMEQIVTSLKIR